MIIIKQNSRAGSKAQTQIVVAIKQALYLLSYFLNPQTLFSSFEVMPHTPELEKIKKTQQIIS